ncbi:hypothetical protein BDV25DRAFT_136412 [Aspergillus avenaceus]|uniref:Uncharacterized protein n=1 Tax=Aspergillus avenaceus TaxID=36643 RepID=A0A5N6U5C7_ASPAV|nr:hypothetical protein BDV25DRAFT_136412 [Aspergillus avenaceus]
MTNDNQVVIDRGSVAARYGLFKADAALYLSTGGFYGEDGKIHPPRNDRNIFQNLYGVGPSIAEKIEYTPTILVLERHAASGEREGINNSEARFHAFIRALEEANYTGNYLDRSLPEWHHLRELVTAYREFWDASDLVNEHDC